MPDIIHVPYKFPGYDWHRPNVAAIVSRNVKGDTPTMQDLERILEELFAAEAEMYRQNWLEIERWADRTSKRVT
jgi:hypothetical protein